MTVLQHLHYRGRPGRLPVALLLVGAVLGLLAPQRGWAQNNRPLVAGYALKFGASYSESFIEVTRLSDDSVATLVSDGDASPYASFSSPPFFLGLGGLALGVSASYNQFTASRQSFGGGPGPQTTGNTASGQLVTVTPEAIYYIGRDSPTQYFRIAAGLGWGLANFSGNVQFGTALGAEPPEPFQSPNGTIAAVSFSLEYRFRNVALGYTAGGPTAANDRHNFKWGDAATTLSYVINL